MSVLPAKRHAILLIHPDTVTTRLIALQQFKPIPRRDRQIVKAGGRVEQSQLPLNQAPEFPWDAPCGSGVSLAKQIDGSAIGE
jgi:hypothetical protein